jgi:NitT/TauT family transport system substrate-binding protein
MRLVQAAARMGPGGIRRWPGAAAAAAALFLLAAGCGVPGAPSGQGSGTAQLTVAVVPGLANAPLQVAVRDGLFAQRGLNVTVQEYGSLQQAYAAFAGGQAQVIGGGYAGLFYMQARTPHLHLRLIADGYDAAPGLMEVLTLPGSAVTAPQDLEGKAVATPLPELAPFSADAPYNTETLAAQAVLQSDGVSPTSVQWEAMAPGSMISALRDRAVSAIVATEPYVLQAEMQLGAVELFDACDGVTASLPLSGYFTSARFARGAAAVLRSFQAALSDAKAGTDQFGPAQSVLGTLPGMSARQAAVVTVGQYPAFLSTGQVQRVADLMYGTGMITTAITVRDLVLR